MKRLPAGIISTLLSLTMTLTPCSMSALAAQENSRDFSLFFSGPGVAALSSGDEYSVVAGLDMGADDYVSKPFSTEELVARVKAQLRRYMTLGSAYDSEPGSEEIHLGDLVLNKDQKQMYVSGEEVRLTATEYRIVELLMSYPGRVFSSEEIYSRVWNEDAYAVENTVMVHIRRIREKIEIDPKNPKYLKVVWGIGYKMEKV